LRGVCVKVAGAMQSINLLKDRQLRRCVARRGCACHPADCPQPAAALRQSLTDWSAPAPNAEADSSCAARPFCHLAGRCGRIPRLPR
jgi:hypothetical protein